MIAHTPDGANPAWYDDLIVRPGVAGIATIANLAVTLDGRVAIDGRSSGIGSRLDRHLMFRLRAWADCVLVGAKTWRTEPVATPLPAELIPGRRSRGQADQPRFAIAAGRTAIDVGSAARVTLSERPLVFATRPSGQPDAADWAEVIPIERRHSLAAIVRHLSTRCGVGRLLVEGGPHLLTSALRADLVDELFLTIGPRLIGGSQLTLTAGARLNRPCDLISVYAQDSEVFCRYRVRRPSP